MAYESCGDCYEGCKFFDRKPIGKLKKTQENGGYKDVHHVFWPAGFYKTAIEKAFRELPENKVLLCRAEHDDIHATEEPPAKPRRGAMIQAIAESAINNSGENHEEPVHHRIADPEPRLPTEDI